ncbi:MAG: isoaspartyl peptidase/L-asparaginase [Bacteroidota bacterium]
MKRFAIAIHGGSGTILRSHMPQEKEVLYRKGLEEALSAGYAHLEQGGTALDATEIAVKILEDNALFNAGKGAVFDGDGKHQLDASIMRGDTLEAGAVAGVRGVKNPISLARKVMEESAYVMMIGRGAEKFARLHKLPFKKPEYFFDQLRYDQWLRIKDTPMTMLDHADKGERNFSTVGAVALDQDGNLAAATSTGGMTNKQYGRVGDSPIIGSGTYADNKTCAVCCTGHGEPFMRAVAAHRLSALMEYKGVSLKEAANELVHVKLEAMQGKGGLIAVDRSGNIELAYNCEGMYRASRVAGKSPYIGIFDTD